MKRRPQTISFVIPCFNEEENVDETYKQINQYIHSERKYDFEFIFIDNCSTDATRQHIRTLTTKDSRVTGIFLSRNFGPEASALAGLEYAKGDGVITTVCDLQDPLELIPEYIKRWERGNNIVIGAYTKTADTWYMAKIRSVYYRIFKSVSSIDIPVNSSGITLFSRSALNAFLQLQERFRSSVGLRAWIGFRVDTITYERRDRRRGKSSYNIFRYLQAAERGFIGFSYLPLDLIIFIGLFLFAISVIFLFVYLIGIVVGFVKLDQFVVLITAMILFGGMQLLALSAIGKYVQVIVEETKRRPHYIVEEILKKNGRL